MIITLAFALLSTASRQFAHDIISQLQTVKTEFNGIPETNTNSVNLNMQNTALDQIWEHTSKQESC